MIDCFQTGDDAAECEYLEKHLIAQGGYDPVGHSLAFHLWLSGSHDTIK